MGGVLCLKFTGRPAAPACPLAGGAAMIAISSPYSSWERMQRCKEQGVASTTGAADHKRLPTRPMAVERFSRG